jgi:hypothetical protein
LYVGSKIVPLVNSKKEGIKSVTFPKLVTLKSRRNFL